MVILQLPEAVPLDTGAEWIKVSPSQVPLEVPGLQLRSVKARWKLTGPVEVEALPSDLRDTAAAYGVALSPSGPITARRSVVEMQLTLRGRRVEKKYLPVIMDVVEMLLDRFVTLVEDFHEGDALAVGVRYHTAALRRRVVLLRRAGQPQWSLFDGEARFAGPRACPTALPEEIHPLLTDAMNQEGAIFPAHLMPWQRRFRRALAVERGRHEAIVTLQAHVEEYLQLVLRLALLDRGKSLEEALAEVRGLSSVGTTGARIGQVLGGNFWDTKRVGGIFKRYLDDCNELRNAAIHRSEHIPLSKLSAAADAYKALREAIGEQAQQKARQFPRVVLLHDPMSQHPAVEGLRAAGRWWER